MYDCFFFKQKTADEMRISDWSSDVCSSDLKKTAEAHDINYVEDMTKDDIQKLFDSNGDGKADLVACPPGWGCEEMIAYHYEAYDWDDDFNAIKAGYSASIDRKSTRLNSSH